MFVRNAWYVGAWSDEVAPGGMLTRTLLNEPVLFYRSEDGKLAALQDRCCHRGLPLSHGCVQGERVQCGYHGLVFDARGLCVKVPGQDRVPPAAKVRSYPVVEKQGMAWIWMGEPERADPAGIVSHPYHEDPDWAWIKDCYRVEANYQLITDNLMDLTHVGYVHTRTIGGTPQAHSEALTTTTGTERGVRVERWMLDSVPPPSYTAAHTFGTERVDRWMEIEFFAPCIVRIHTGAVDIGTGAREGRREGGIRFQGLNVQTPETDSSTHYFWSGARNRSAERDEQRDKLLDSLSITFAEDKVVVEAQQKSLDKQAEPLVMIASDAGMMRARRMVSQMLETEQG
ncbi:MAG TPA: aromatic ring-hydroxylating dioxygenase subunit alpha [Ramlibacter sp.]|nr:aromatic ring-hydroxylating dioxygenase subunit alpha [Ramlibacter sp.]